VSPRNTVETPIMAIMGTVTIHPVVHAPSLTLLVRMHAILPLIP